MNNEIAQLKSQLESAQRHYDHHLSELRKDHETHITHFRDQLNDVRAVMKDGQDQLRDLRAQMEEVCAVECIKKAITGV